MCTQQLPQPAQSGCCANSSAHSSRARLAAPSFTAQCLRVPVPVTPPRLFSQPAANLEGNPSLSLVYLCFSPTTATVEKSFPFSCEHLPLQTLTFRNHQHRAGERELSPLHRASSAGAKQTRGVWCAAGCSVTFVSAHTSTTQLLSATRRSTASSELFLTCLLTNSFLLLKDTARCLTWHQSYAPRRPSHKEGRQKWCYLPEWKSGFGQDLGLRTLASPDPRRIAYWGVPNKLQHSLFPFLISETKIAFAYFIIVRYRSLSKCSQQQTFKEKPCSEHLCYQIKRRSHSNAAMHSPIPQSRSASMSFQVWDHSTGL